MSDLPSAFAKTLRRPPRRKTRREATAPDGNGEHRRGNPPRRERGRGRARPKGRGPRCARGRREGKRARAITRTTAEQFPARGLRRRAGPPAHRRRARYPTPTRGSKPRSPKSSVALGLAKGAPVPTRAAQPTRAVAARRARGRPSPPTTPSGVARSNALQEAVTDAAEPSERLGARARMVWRRIQRRDNNLRSVPAPRRGHRHAPSPPPRRCLRVLGPDAGACDIRPTEQMTGRHLLFPPDPKRRRRPTPHTRCNWTDTAPLQGANMQSARRAWWGSPLAAASPDSGLRRIEQKVGKRRYPYATRVCRRCAGGTSALASAAVTTPNLRDVTSRATGPPHRLRH